MEWREVRARAIAFVKEWEHETRERAEAQSFWNDFFQIFGIKRRRVAVFEHHVAKLNKKHGFVDLLWPGRLLAEHKSKGRSLVAACEQATNYFDHLSDDQLPAYVIVSDFARIRLVELETKKEWQFPVAELPDKIQLFSFIFTGEKKKYTETSPVTEKAGEMLGKLYDLLKATGYPAKDLEVYLVRLLFCLFGDDTGIFEPQSFADLVDSSKEDGSDLGLVLAGWFECLDTPREKRANTLSSALDRASYVNGKLFSKRLPLASFTGAMRSLLIECSQLNWSSVCPSVFGNLFQSIMNEAIRRQKGAHYTAEKNIRKVIDPLFLEELHGELEASKRNGPRLAALHKKLATLRFLDPACGCGNFLVVAYRELRQLEIDVVKAMFKGTIPSDIREYVRVNVDQFYGIEQDEFAVQVARVALWLTDHQMNNIVSKDFGEMYTRLPLTTSPYIIQGNALRLDWNELVQLFERGEKNPDNGSGRFDYILGNPPFVGYSLMDDGQKRDMQYVFGDAVGAGMLDYVCAWYKKAAEYTTTNSSVKCAFVSTNSITQGIQPAYLWSELFKYGVLIEFAHRTFKWQNEGRGGAAVCVVIIGFSAGPMKRKRRLYSYVGLAKDEPTESVVENITPYLVSGETVLVFSRNEPLCSVEKMRSGNKIVDGGHYLFDDDEFRAFVKKEPASRKYFKRIYGSQEFINNEKRWCLFLTNCSPLEIKNMPLVKRQVEAVRDFRQKSKKAKTRELGETPLRFEVETVTKNGALLVPKTSSEERNYLPMGFLGRDCLVSDAALVVDAGIYGFGILQSAMHMAWVRAFAGRLETRYRYSVNLVYNNYPWPENVSEKLHKAVEVAAQGVLDARNRHPDCTLAVLYDDTLMPSDLRQAHTDLDKAVDACYGRKFGSEEERVEYLLSCYKNLIQKKADNDDD